MKFHHVYMNKAGEEGGGGDKKVDRGDEVTLADRITPITDEEKKLAEEIKTKADGDAKAKTDAEAKAKADAEAKAKAEADEEDDPDNPGHKRKRVETRIPLARHKEILEAERTERAKLEAKLAQYQQGEDIAETNEKLTKAEDELLKLEKSYADLITDSKPAEAAKVMAEIRKTERFIGETRSDLKSAAAESRAYERARYDTTVERVESAYPELNPDNKEDAPDDNPNKGKFDVAKTRKVMSIARAYQADGLTPSKALQEAVKDLLGEPKSAKQKEAVEVKPKVDEAAAAKAKREEEARAKAADAAGKTPANTNLAGKDSDKLGGSLGAADVMKMSFADFSKLDTATLSRMRGDELAA